MLIDTFEPPPKGGGFLYHKIFMCLFAAFCVPEDVVVDGEGTGAWRGKTGTFTSPVIFAGPGDQQRRD